MLELDKLAEDVGEERVRRLLVEIGARGALVVFDRTRAGRMASRLLGNRVPRARVVERLQARFGFSRRTCYNIVEEQLCNPLPPFAQNLCPMDDEVINERGSE